MMTLLVLKIDVTRSVFQGHAMPIRSLAFSPDSQLLITASDDNHIKMYDVYPFNAIPFAFNDLTFLYKILDELSNLEVQCHPYAPHSCAYLSKLGTFRKNVNVSWR